MWTTVAVLASLSLAPNQAGSLSLTNQRITYGIHGAPRTDIRVLPGDSLCVAFDIEGVKVDDAGKVLYSIATEVFDSNNRSQFKNSPRDQEAVNSLGGNRLPATAFLDIGLDQLPGEYTLKVTVTDRAARASKELTQKFTVLPKAFGLVRLTTTTDPEGHHPAPFVGDGQSLWLNFGVVGFTRGPTKQPNVTVEMVIRDAAGKPTLAKPFTGAVADKVPENVLGLPMQFLLSLNRDGKFTVELTATDQLSKKTAKATFPLTVLKTK